MVSGSISLPSPGFFSPFPHGTCSLSVIREYLVLADGPARFPPGSSCPVVLGITLAESQFRLQVFHLLWSGLPAHSTISDSHFISSRNPTYISAYGLDYSNFARRYSRNHFCFLFLSVLRCFNSQGSPVIRYLFTYASSYEGVAPFGHQRVKAHLAALRRLSQPITSFFAS